MSQLEFEIFITIDNKQITKKLSEKPVIFGCNSSCDVFLGSGEPKIKAVIQKQDSCLLVKIFDNNFPININGKNYKSAKVKSSMFFKIGSVDIVVSVEEVKSQVEIPKEEILDNVLPDFDEEDTLEIPELFVEPVSEEVSVSELLAKSKVTTIKEAAPVAPSLGVQSAIVGFEALDFEFSYKFRESSFKPLHFEAYAAPGLDFSRYIDPQDETIKVLPSKDIVKEGKGNSIHIALMNNGVVISEDFYDPNLKRIFASNNHSSKNYFKVYGIESGKSEFIYAKNLATHIMCLKGFKMQTVVNGTVIDINDSSIQLNTNMRVVLTNGTTQIVIRYSAATPKVRAADFLTIEDDLLKAVASFWMFIFVMMAIVAGFTPDEEKKVKKQIVTVFKKKKIEKVAKVASATASESAKSEAKKTEPVKKTEAPKPKAEKQVVKKATPKKVTKATKKIAKVVPKKKPVRKNVSKVSKKISKVKKPELAKVAVKQKPKKQYKFNFGSKMSSLLGSTSNTKLKAAESSSSSASAASSMSSSTSVSSDIKSDSIGRSNTKIARFAAGSPSGSSSAIGTKGLSGKKGSSTAYIEANTKILGALDPELIRKIMREFIPHFRRCYQRELISSPEAAGVFDLNFQINGRGKGIRVGVKKTGKDFSSTAKTCLKRVVSLIKFPKPKGGGLVDVKQPMNFYQQ